MGAPYINTFVFIVKANGPSRKEIQTMFFSFVTFPTRGVAGRIRLGEQVNNNRFLNMQPIFRFVKSN
jgi:hypothetical protein